MRHLHWSVFLAARSNFIGLSGRLVPVVQYRVALCWHTSTAQRIPTVRFKMATIQTVDDICDIDELSDCAGFSETVSTTGIDSAETYTQTLIHLVKFRAGKI